MEITRIGLDLAKNVFELYGVDANDKPALSKRLTRAKLRRFFAGLSPCVVAMEACASAHHWGRVLRSLGHEVRLIDARFVRPYRMGGKNDRNDAQAICEAAGRSPMRFVPVKSVEPQAELTVHRARFLLVAERTALVNHIRGLLAEFGLVVPQGRTALRRALPGLARESFAELHDRLLELERRVASYDQRIKALAKASPQAQRLMKAPGIGPLTATAAPATVGHARHFDNGRQFAAWLGLTPRQRSSAGKSRLGRISKRGDRYLRTLLVHGARAVLQRSAQRTDPLSRWAHSVRQRRGFNKAVVALAAKLARILWAMLTREEHFRLEAPHSA